MILLVTALYGEARTFIEQLQMKRLGAFTAWTVYEGAYEDIPVRLLLTGVGKLRACAALSAYLAQCSLEELAGLYVVHTGIAALNDEAHSLKPGTWCMASGVRDAGSYRSFYPDIPSHPFVEMPMCCVDRPVLTLIDGEKCLVDMESAGICEAVSHFLLWDQVAVVKCISDMTDGEKPDAAAVAEMMQNGSAIFLTWLREWALQNASKAARVLIKRRADLRAVLEEIMKKRALTVTMQHQLEQLLYAWACLDGDACEEAKALLRDYGAAEAFPLKREEKQAFATLLEKLEEALDGRMYRQPVKTALHSRRAFSHIYMEQGLKSEWVEPVLEKLSESAVITIPHFKDIFNRTRQDFQGQKQDTALILAKKTEHFVYPGAKVCQSFGNAHFYYASVLMNCLYDCEYCYLQGMYPGAHMVAFVNLEDYFAAVEELLGHHPVYLCISFDTDLLAMEAILGFGKRWCAFAAAHEELTIEIRTKGDGAFFFQEMEGEEIPANVILAWTLSPQQVISTYEHRTADLSHRLLGMKRALEMGFRVRACFDPAIWLPDFEMVYGALLERVFKEIPPEALFDASIGTFRISQEYLKTMRKNRPGSCIVQHPYVNEGGVAGYSAQVHTGMMRFLKEYLMRFLPEERIFLWEPLE